MNGPYGPQWSWQINLGRFNGGPTDELRWMFEQLRAQLDEGTTRQIGESGGGVSAPVTRVTGISLIRNGGYGHSFQSWYPRPILARDGDYECGWWYCHPLTPNAPLYKDRTGLGTFDTGYFGFVGQDVRFTRTP